MKLDPNPFFVLFNFIKYNFNYDLLYLFLKSTLVNWVLVESGVLKECNIEVFKDLLCEFPLS